MSILENPAKTHAKELRMSLNEIPSFFSDRYYPDYRYPDYRGYDNRGYDPRGGYPPPGGYGGYGAPTQQYNDYDRYRGGYNPYYNEPWRQRFYDPYYDRDPYYNRYGRSYGDRQNSYMPYNNDLYRPDR